ncbi:MAG: hypothetical protein JSV03_12760, partial [Planctomycetota bacterium]
MTNTEPTLADLANRGEIEALENRWLAAIDEAEDRRNDMLEALDVLNNNRQEGLASTLAWMWLAGQRDQANPAETLALGREMLLRYSNNDDIRQEIVGLYKKVYADRPEISQLIKASGLDGTKTPRRAL